MSYQIWRMTPTRSYLLCNGRIVRFGPTPSALRQTMGYRRIPVTINHVGRNR